MMTMLIGNACLFLDENLARVLGFKGVCNAQVMNDILKNLCIPYRFKTKVVFGCTFMYYMQVLSVPLVCK